MKNNKDVLVLRTCNSDLTSYGGFQWPASGPVNAPTKYWGRPADMPSDLVLGWDPNRECGGGLHGLLWGEGSGSVLNHEPDAKWLVVRVLATDICSSAGKVRFPRGTVLHVGDKKSATDFILANGAEGKAVVGASLTAGDHGTAKAGDHGTATAGDYGTAEAGDHGTATAGDHGTAKAGYRGTATAGDYGTAEAGYRGTATAGDYGTAEAGYRGTAKAGHKGTAKAGHKGSLKIKVWDSAASRFRFQTGYVGEGGILAGKPYRLNEAEIFVPAE